MMRTIIILIFVNIGLSAQSDTSYIQFIPSDRTIQFHSTVKDLSLKLRNEGKEELLFRNHNWATGFYFKWGIAELFLAIPHHNFDNRTLGAEKSFGTGFGLNFYHKKMHYLYEFKYIQGFNSLEQVLEEKLNLLNANNYFIWNRLNLHYIHRADQYSLKSAIRFNDRQLKSAGSFIIGFPLTHHIASISGSGAERLSRLSIGVLPGTAYTYVHGNWRFAVIAKGGIELRFPNIDGIVTSTLRPAVNGVFSVAYDIGTHFIGLVHNHYPEFDYGDENSVIIENWKLRLYAGKRFGQ